MALKGGIGDNTVESQRFGLVNEGATPEKKDQRGKIATAVFKDAKAAKQKLRQR